MMVVVTVTVWPAGHEAGIGDGAGVTMTTGAVGELAASTGERAGVGTTTTGTG